MGNEIIKDIEICLLEQFIEKLHTVMNFSEKKYNEMSKYAYEYGCKKYSVAGAVERFEQLMEE